MGSSSSAQRRSAKSSQLDTVKSGATTPTVPSKQEVQSEAPGQPAVAEPSGGASGPTATPAAATTPSRTSDHNSAMAKPEGLQREKTFGFSSAQPTYTVCVLI